MCGEIFCEVIFEKVKTIAYNYAVYQIWYSKKCR